MNQQRRSARVAATAHHDGSEGSQSDESSEDAEVDDADLNAYATGAPVVVPEMALHA